ncbi:MAG: protein kinase, partial [Spirochaetes bacterium]
MKRALIALLGIFILSAGLSAQTRTSLTIKSNQAGAKVFINGNLVGTADPEFSALLSSDARPYTIKLTKDGYQDFQTTVIIRGDPVTVIATLVPMAQKPPAPNPPGPPTPPAPPPPQSATHFLSIESNVAGAQVFIDGVYYGTTPLSIRLQARRYTLRVTKPGHKDFLKTLELKRSERIYAQVEPLLYSVLIEAANAPGARLYKDS